MNSIALKCQITRILFGSGHPDQEVIFALLKQASELERVPTSAPSSNLPRY